MKKIFSLIILVSLSLTLFSCSRKEDIFKDDSEVDFHGATFTVYSNGKWVSDTRTRGESASRDRFLDRVEEIERNYNFKIYSESSDLQRKILAMTLNGGGGCDMLYCGNDDLFVFYDLGILTPFEEIGVNDHEDEKFGIPSLLVEGTFGGTRYGIVNYLGDSMPGVRGFIGINIKQLENLSMTDPREYVEQGEWDWEQLHQDLRKGTYTDGEIKYIGMLSEYMLGGIHAFQPAIISNGGYIIREIDGVYKTGLTEANAMEAIEFMAGLVQEEILQVVGGDAWIPWTANDNWLYKNDEEMSGGSDRQIVRFPYGPSGNQDIVAAYSYNRNYYAFTMLSTFGDDEIGKIVDDLFEPLDASLYPEGWKDYAIENIFNTDADYETYMKGLETMDYYPIGVFYGTNMWSFEQSEIEDALYRILMGRGSAQTEIDSIKDLLAQTVNEKLNNIK